MLFHIIKEAAVNANGLVAMRAFHVEMIVMTARKTVERTFTNAASVEARDRTVGDETVKSAVDGGLGDTLTISGKSADDLVRRMTAAVSS